MDPSEASFSQPLLYTQGWGKQLNYVLAVGLCGAADVTRRYTTDSWEALLARRALVSERWLSGLLASLTAHLRAGLPPEQLALLSERDQREQQQLSMGSQAMPADLALPARQTGDAAWLAARGENGAARAAASGSGIVAAGSGTRWRWARDEGLRGAHEGRVCGGAVRASGENTPSEVAEKAFDGRVDSKWLDFGGPTGGSWIEYRLPKDRPAVTVTTYSLTAANDSPERDPRHVMLEAWSEGKDRETDSAFMKCLPGSALAHAEQHHQ